MNVPSFAALRAGLAPGRRRFSGWWILAGMLALPCVYLPTLATRFDFTDDGNLVYPFPVQSWGERINHCWTRIASNFHDLGPFRPTLWMHWEAEANLLGADPLRWRCARLVWASLAAGAFLWLLRELGLPASAALGAVALAMWNPFRNEIWTSLTLSEGVAMPYALLAVVSALRAARSPCAWRWDVAGTLAMLVALGCKNTFAAVVPVQVLLRIAPEGLHIRRNCIRHVRTVGLLSSPLLLPIGHFIVFRWNWHPGQYEANNASWAQLGGMLHALIGAESIDFMAPGLVLALLAVLLHGTRVMADDNPRFDQVGRTSFERLRQVANQYRAALLAGFGLLILGVGVYLPIGAISGRYSMPAVWGADLCIAALLGGLSEVRHTKIRSVAIIAIVLGLCITALANVGRQEKFQARIDLLWNTVEYVERVAPQGTCIAWMSGPALNVEEGIHFGWHLQQRGRKDLVIRLFDEHERPVRRVELTSSDRSPHWVLTGTRSPADRDDCLIRAFKTSYWRQHQAYQCFLWQAPERTASHARLGE